MHNINLTVIRTEDAINNNIPYYSILNGYCVTKYYNYELSLKLKWLRVKTDYFGGFGEQSSNYLTNYYNSINEGLLDVFKIERNEECDQFDFIGLSTIRTNSDIVCFNKNIHDLIENINILNVYIFGSQVYGTNIIGSDTDLIVVAKEYFDSDDINIHVYTVENFQLLINRHDIQALECLSLSKSHNDEYIIKELYKFEFPKLDLAKLRVSISTIASNSYVKGKKKLTVAGDYDLNLAIKSIFHSLRILDFGIQLANIGYIENYSSVNFILDDLKKLSENYQREELWLKIDEKYRKLYNSKSSQFKSLAPKDLTNINKKSELIEIFKNHKQNTQSDFFIAILNYIL